MNVHQFVHTLSYGDAISGEATAIQRLLRSLGYKSEIYCLHSHEKVKECARLWTNFTPDLELALAANEDTAVILHYSIGSPLNSLYQSETRIAKALIYHNLTPEKWFLGYNPRVVADLIQGRAELPELLKIVDIALADSEYNRLEMEQFGCLSARVLPLFLDLEKWSVAANPGIARALRGHGGLNVLHVGRFAPNKRLEDILKAFYFFHHKIEPKSKLWLVGSDIDTEIYSFELRRLATELRLDQVVECVGTVADSELRAFYENSDVYLCMSEHEGFCVPLIEAMHFELPVIAYNSTAVGDTLGGGGILLGRKSPAEVAELMSIVCRDGTVREQMVRAGKQRTAEFVPDRFLSNLRNVLLDPLEKLFREGALGSAKARQCQP